MRARYLQINHEWDTVTNDDFNGEFILGFFRNVPIEDRDESGFADWFDVLTAVKCPEVCPDGARYEQHYGRRWQHFRRATIEEIAKHCSLIDKGIENSGGHE